MQASDFEFRNRFFFIGLLFGLAFFCYSIDPINAATALVSAIIGRDLNLESAPDRHSLQLLLAFATLLVAASAAIRTWATAYLQTDVVHDPSLHTEGVVADGPYRHVRNPLYFANVLLSIGMGLLASRLGFAVLVLGMLLVTYRLIGREEEQLAAAQEERYSAYRNAVPRLWPSFSPRLPSGPTRPRWAQAWLGEAFFWGFASAVGGFAITLRPRYLYLITGASLAFYVVLMLILKATRGGRDAAGSLPSSGGQ
jgi:isoprenylcysteine carboxyl methyltransferase (ICMT) family protein YpbQ